MKFKRITIVTDERYPDPKVIGGTDVELIAEFKDVNLHSADETETRYFKQKLWIWPDKGERIEINDIGFVGIWRDIIRFKGYLVHDYKKYKKGTRVEINIWNYENNEIQN